MRILGIPSNYDLSHIGITNANTIFWNLYPPDIIEQVLQRKEGKLASRGAIVVNTGQFTGRSPKDKFLVQYPRQEKSPLNWNSPLNKTISPEQFEQVLRKMTAYLQQRDIFVRDMYVGAHPQYRIPIRVITDNAWQSLFANDLFIRVPVTQLQDILPEYTLIACPGFMANPKEDGLNSGTLILLDFERKLVLIGGTNYAGEIKKSMFSVLNYILPQKGILSMHCSANVGKKGRDVALFFGLSGTGKTTLSSNPNRSLIGDDEHGWADDGVFNIEGGCYAKTIRLDAGLEPIIWEASQRFGSVLENVIVDPTTGVPDFNDSRLTENTRAAYPLSYVANYVPEGRADHPSNIFFLTADASGVLPPIARLTSDQIMYYFLLGYTSKLAGTERGLGAEPQATFSACFAAPFIPLPPNVYAQLLLDKVNRHQVSVWLVNTGWTGGPYGVGERIKLPYTRAIIDAVMDHSLASVPWHIDPYFGLQVPDGCPGVPDVLLSPSQTWEDQSAYRQSATKLLAQFEQNFAQYAISAARVT